jgi:hypothetical protein
VALIGSKTGCLSFALHFGFLYGCGSFWAAWVGSSLGVFLVGLLGYIFLCTWRRFALF